MLSLPNDLVSCIYEYDPTYHQIYKIVILNIPKYIVFSVIVEKYVSRRFIIDLDNTMIITNSLTSPSFKSTVYFYNEEDRLSYMALMSDWKRVIKVPSILYFASKFMSLTEYVEY